MNIKKVYADFSFCKVEDYSKVNLEEEYCFVGKTAGEKSLVCLTENVPEGAYDVSDGWKCMYIEGKIAFTLLGVVSSISSILADNRVPIKFISTYDTDYIFVLEKDFDRSMDILKRDGYKIVE